MTSKTPEQIATDIAATMTPYGLGSTESPLTNFERALVAAIEADRAQRHDALDRVRAVLNAEIGWETPAVLKERIEWALNGEAA